MGATTFTKSGVVNYAKSRSALAGEAFFDPNFDVEYLVIAGGGGGGLGGGGGGAGGYRSSVSGESSGGGASAESVLTLSRTTNYTVTVGAGGSGSSTGNVQASSGASSVFYTITSTGGGGAGSSGVGENPQAEGLDGGSGGGGSGIATLEFPGGSGAANQGFDGGNGYSSSQPQSTGGGGGASEAGADGANAAGGDGGDGVSSSISGSAITRAGGGGGAFRRNRGSGSVGSGGNGGGGNGSVTSSGDNADQNTGSGGGAGGRDINDNNLIGGNGGSGVVILRYPTSVVLSAASGLTGTTTTVGQNKVTQITAGTGNISFTTTGAEAFPEPPDYPAFLDSAPLWLDASDASTITESGGSVSQWNNKGTLSNFTQATSALQPTTGATTLNGLNVLDFNQDVVSNAGTSTDYTFMQDGTSYFVSYVAKYGTLGSDVYTIFGNWNGDNVNNGVLNWNDNRSGVGTNRLNYEIGASNSNRVVSIRDDNFWDSNFTIFSALLDPDNGTAADRIDYYKNSTQGSLNNGGTQTPSSGTPRDNFNVGGHSPAFGSLIGSIAELIIVSGADATEANRQAVVDYLNAKWSVF